MNILPLSKQENEGGQLLIMASSNEITSPNGGINPVTALVHVPLTCTETENAEKELVTSDDDMEKEERRKIAQKVLEKQG